MKILAWVELILVVIAVLITPFFIGKARKPWEPTDCLVSIIRASMLVPLLGRVLGWW